MSATLRYDVGTNLAEAITNHFPGLLSHFAAEEAVRWGGVHRRGKRCLTFAVKLPRQVDQAYRLVCAAERMTKLQGSGVGLVVISARVLCGKLRASLGLPAAGAEPAPHERGFFGAIDLAPGTPANWAVYADWLEEQDDKGMNRRGRVIHAWLGSKAAPVKYGVILEACAGADRCDYRSYPGGETYGRYA